MTSSPDVPPPSVRAVDRTWAVLMVVTVVTTWVLTKDWMGADVAAVVMMALVGAKVWLILMEFMELRGAPRLVAAAFTVWSFALPVGLAVAVSRQ